MRECGKKLIQRVARASVNEPPLSDDAFRLFRALARLPLHPLALDEPEHQGHRLLQRRHVLCDQKQTKRQHPQSQHRQEAQEAADNEQDRHRDTYVKRRRLPHPVNETRRTRRQLLFEPGKMAIEVGFIVHGQYDLPQRRCCVSSQLTTRRDVAHVTSKAEGRSDLRGTANFAGPIGGLGIDKPETHLLEGLLGLRLQRAGNGLLNLGDLAGGLGREHTLDLEVLHGEGVIVADRDVGDPDLVVTALLPDLLDHLDGIGRIRGCGRADTDQKHGNCCGDGLDHLQPRIDGMLHSTPQSRYPVNCNHAVEIHGNICGERRDARMPSSEVKATTAALDIKRRGA